MIKIYDIIVSGQTVTDNDVKTLAQFSGTVVVDALHQYMLSKVCGGDKDFCAINFDFKMYEHGDQEDSLFLQLETERKYSVRGFFSALFHIPTHGIRPLIGLTYKDINNILEFLFTAAHEHPELFKTKTIEEFRTEFEKLEK